jgi:uncharacterized membrane protein
MKSKFDVVFGFAGFALFIILASLLRNTEHRVWFWLASTWAGLYALALVALLISSMRGVK